jgi:hypothetical protein
MRDDRMLQMHRCRICGCVMWWVPMDKTYDRMGINARMLAPGAWDGVVASIVCGRRELW